jgi:hypothetical protein
VLVLEDVDDADDADDADDVDVADVADVVDVVDVVLLRPPAPVPSGMWPRSMLEITSHPRAAPALKQMIEDVAIRFANVVMDPPFGVWVVARRSVLPRSSRSLFAG